MNAAIQFRNNFDRILGMFLVVGAMLFGANKVLKYSFDDNLSKFSESDYLDLTAADQAWDIRLLKGKREIHKFTSTLPFNSFGKLSGYNFDNLIISTNLKLPEQFKYKEIGLHSMFVVANDYRWKVDGKILATNKSHGFEELFLPISSKALNFDANKEVELSMNTKGLEEPGLDLRGELVIGERALVEDLTQTKNKAYSIFSVWVIGVLLMLGLLLILGGLLDHYSMEFNLLGFYCVVSALKASIFFGSVEIIDIGIVNRWASFNTLDLFGNALLFGFFSYFFRRDFNLRKKIIFALIALSILNMGIAYFYEGAYQYVSLVYEASNIILYCIAAYGIVASTATYLRLKENSLNQVRKYVALATAIILVVVTPALVWLHNSKGFFWLALPSFQVAFNLLMASLISIGHGAERKSRAHIWKKMASTVDRSVLEEILTKDYKHRKWVDNAAVMFIDLKGFTGLCESYDARLVSEHLGKYYDIVVTAVHKQGGMVDKFIGDGVMAAWGATGQVSFDMSSPLKAALEILEKIDQENKFRTDENLVDFELGIGIHSGRVCAGIIGNDQRAEFTVIGNPVNIASRLESISREMNDRIILSGDYYDQVKHQFSAHHIGTTELKGLKQPITYVTVDLYHNQLVDNAG